MGWRDEIAKLRTEISGLRGEIATERLQRRALELQIQHLAREVKKNTDPVMAPPVMTPPTYRDSRPDNKLDDTRWYIQPKVPWGKGEPTSNYCPDYRRDIPPLPTAVHVDRPYGAGLVSQRYRSQMISNEKEAAVGENGKWVRVGPSEYRAAGKSGSKRRVIYTQTHRAPGDVEDKWVQEVFREELPLPDKPGVRFWGKTSSLPARWWFSALVNSRIRYYADNGAWIDTDICTTVDLVRLPDPKD